MGIASSRFDVNGQGKSDGEFEDMTVPSEMDDARSVVDDASKRDFVENISVLGHSLGGAVASMLAGELGVDKIKSVVLMAAVVVFKDQALEGNILGVPFDPPNIPEYVTVYGHKIGKMYLKPAQDMSRYMAAAKFNGRVCFIQGKKEDVVPYTYA